jgi:hypothetical protein
MPHSWIVTAAVLLGRVLLAGALLAVGAAIATRR